MESESNKKDHSTAWCSDDSDDDWGDVGNSTWNIQTVTSSASSEIDLEHLLQSRDNAMTDTVVIKNKKSQSNAKKTTNQQFDDATSINSTLDCNKFEPIYLQVEEEPPEDYSNTKNFNHENKLLEDYIKQEQEEKSSDIENLKQYLLPSKKEKARNSSSERNAGFTESYERTPLNEKLFLRFQERIKRCPNQCLRFVSRTFINF